MASIFPLFPQKRLILRLDTTNPRRGVYRIPYPMPTSQSPHHHFRHNVKYRNFPLISYDVKTGQTRLRNYSHFIDDRFKRNATKSCLFSARLHVIFLEFPLYGLVCLSVYCFYRNPLPHSGLSWCTWTRELEKCKQNKTQPSNTSCALWKNKQTNKTMRKSSLFV